MPRRPRKIERTPPWMQITQAIRAQILGGELNVGDRVPSARKLAEDWKVAQATALRAISTLQSEGLVEARVGVGTIVTARTTARSPRDRIQSLRRTGRLYNPHERAEVVSAELVAAPERVSSAMGLEPNALVIRRQRVTFRNGGDAVEMSVSWMPAEFADAVPELLGTAPVGGGTASRVRDVMGRTIVMGRDRLSSRPATDAEAASLGIDPGVPILAGTNVWADEIGVIEYGEFVLPTSHVLGYEYTVDYEYQSADVVVDDEDPSP